MDSFLRENGPVRVGRELNYDDSSGTILPILSADGTPVSVSYASADREAESGPTHFRGEERIKDTGSRGLGDTRSGVRHFHYDPVQSLTISTAYPNCYFPARSHCLDRVEKDVQEQLLQLGFFDGDKRRGVLEIRMHARPRLLELCSKQLKCVLDGLGYVDRAHLRRLSCSDAAKACHKIVDPRNLANYDFGEVLSKVPLGKTVGKQFGKGSDSD